MNRTRSFSVVPIIALSLAGLVPQPVRDWRVGATHYLLGMALAQGLYTGQFPLNCPDRAQSPARFWDPVAPSKGTALPCKDELKGDGFRLWRVGTRMNVEVSYEGHEHAQSTDFGVIKISPEKVASRTPEQRAEAYCTLFASHWDNLIQAYALIYERFPKGMDDISAAWGDPLANNPLLPGGEKRIKEMLFDESAPKKPNTPYEDKFRVDWKGLQVLCPLTSGTSKYYPLAVARFQYRDLIDRGKEPMPDSPVTRTVLSQKPEAK